MAARVTVRFAQRRVTHELSVRHDEDWPVLPCDLIL